MKLAVVGSRTFGQRDVLFERVAAYVATHPVTSLVTGGARGADALAEEVARELSLPCTIVRAEWRTHGRAAGPLRNAKIAKLADAVLAFVDKPLAESSGTHDTVRRFRKLGKPVEVVEVARP